jgi:hypothetical protein
VHLPITNETDMATSQVDFVVPICSVQQSALVFVDAWNGRPLPVVENARSIHKDIAMIVDDLTANKILHLHIVAALGFVPSCASHLMLCLDIFVETVLSCKIVEVGEDFS